MYANEPGLKHNEWQPDVLGDEFESLTFDLGPDDNPASTDKSNESLRRTDEAADASQAAFGGTNLAATLIRALPAPQSLWKRLTGAQRPFEGIDVLYVHGWSDYFFQRELARFWTNRGATFFALDLRRYGRSLREGQTPGYVANLADYDAEIGLAIEAIRAQHARPSREPKRRLVLLGHSTGGLVLSLWAARNPGVADALVLNSPWLEFQLASRGRQLLSPIVRLSARHNPQDVAPLLDQGFYSRAQREVGPQHALADLNLTWRPEQVRQVSTGWLSAILEGQAQVHAGLAIDVPICVLLSANSTLPMRWSDEITHSDSVLDVHEVAKAALKLGDSVTIEWIDGALHDIFLSADKPRANAYGKLERWLVGWSAAARAGAR